MPCSRCATPSRQLRPCHAYGSLPPLRAWLLLAAPSRQSPTTPEGDAMPPTSVKCEWKEHDAEEVCRLPMQSDMVLWVCQMHYNHERPRRAARGLPRPAWESRPRPGEGA
jgi:hypothetical protein